MENERINIAKDFSSLLGGRYKKIGPFSGELFFEEVLESKYMKAIENNCQLEIFLDGTRGYSSSFLDESFGKLARIFGLEKVRKTLIFRTNDFQWVIDYINQNVWKEK